MNETILKYQQMVAQHPENELARFSLGKAFYDAGDHATALTHFHDALKRKGDWMVVQILIGKSELAMGNKEKAMDAFKRARKLALDQNHQGPLAEMDELLGELQD